MANSIVKSFPTLLLEVLMIVIGVLVGIWANDWRENRNHRKEAQASLKLITQEIQANQEELLDVLPNRKRMDSTFQVLLAKIIQDSNYNYSFQEVMAARGGEGIRIPLLERSAWDLAHQTGNFQYFDLELAASLSEVYSFQKAYQKTQDHIYQNGYIAGNVDLQNLASTVLTTSAILTDMLQQEDRLVNRAYPEVLAKLVKEK